MKNKPLLIALDVNRSEDALALAAQLSPELCRIKVGKELYTREGRALVETLQGIGYDIFLDLKFLGYDVEQSGSESSDECQYGYCDAHSMVSVEMYLRGRGGVPLGLGSV